MRLTRLAPAAVLAGIVLVAAWLTVGSLAGGRQQRAAEVAWAESFPGEGDPLSRFPKAAANASARRVEELAARLGIDAVPPNVGRIQPEPADAMAIERMLTPILRAVGSQRTKEDDVPPAMPEAVTTALQAQAAVLEALETHLLGAPVPEWERDLGLDRPLPRLSALRQLHSLLLARALVAAGRSDAGAAGRALAAADRLVTGLRGRPELICQIIAMSFDGFHHAVLRSAAAALAGTGRGPTAHDYRQSVLTALRLDAWRLGQVIPRAGLGALEGGPWSSEGRLVATVTRPFVRPYFRYCAADYSQRVRRMALTLRATPPCALGELRLSHEPWRQIPRWNVLGRSGMPDLMRVWFTVGHLEREAELTRRVLELQSGAAAEGDHPSDVCPGLVWRYQAAPGGVLITVAREPAASAIGAGAPRRFVVTRGRPGAI
jgi:hypothetical protein